jgi:hypothetical protein
MIIRNHIVDFPKGQWIRWTYRKDRRFRWNFLTDTGRNPNDYPL